MTRRISETRRGSRFSEGRGRGASLLLFYNEKKKQYASSEMSSAAQPPILNRIIHERTEKCCVRWRFPVAGAPNRTSSFQSQISGSERKRSRCCHLSLNNFFLFLVTDTRKGRERRAIFASLSPNILFRNIYVSFGGKRWKGSSRNEPRNRVSRGVAKENGSGKVLPVERIIQSVSEWRIHRERLKVKRSPFDPNRGNYFISSRRYGIKLKRERECSKRRRGKGRGRAVEGSSSSKGYNSQTRFSQGGYR